MNMWFIIKNYDKLIKWLKDHPENEETYMEVLRKQIPDNNKRNK